MHGQQRYAKPHSATPRTCTLPHLFCLPLMRVYGALHNTTTTMVQAIDEREVPSVDDSAPVSTTRGIDFEHALTSMHKDERRTPAYSKLAFA
jgi:hypothetical protein